MGALRVLMVDDDPDLRGLLRRAPAEEGLAVVKPFHIAEIVGRLRALLRRVTVADLPDGGARFRLELPAA
jgi:DNA-binding response OmpR family regulator